MKKAFVAMAAAAALSIFASGAIAGPQVVGDNADSVQIKRSGYKLAPAEFNEYANLFVLDSGSKIKFSSTVNRYYAEVPGESRTEMYPQAPGVFKTAAGTRIEFREGGDVVAIDNLERLPMAHKMPATGVTVLARR
ncbi:hypothetical protein [Pseudoduganella aquatica]|uniref:Gel scht n=1 Tax=Pseudoduganella aquatica TaxID=2660641 RepID=A0A7X4KNV5_9BURK|nr:hypothetical protein [Pseudoduganella aquatica]MYN08546.1 hypothetical protein [Pseudoduganella aquatica]